MFPAERTIGPWRGVVVGFDGSDRARCAVRWAAEQADARHCPLHVVRVIAHHTPAMVAGWLPVLTGPDRDERDLIEDELLTEVGAVRDRHPALEVHAAMHDGAPSLTLAEHADMVGANVLAVGRSDPGAVSRFLHGSTGTDLVRSTRQLVVVVRDLTPVQQAAMATGYASVVAVLDDTDTSPRVLAFARDMADRMGTGMTVVPSALETVGADLTDTVLDLSADAALVVVGDRRQGVVQRLLAGSVGHRALHHARCTVAAIP